MNERSAVQSENQIPCESPPNWGRYPISGFLECQSVPS